MLHPKKTIYLVDDDKEDRQFFIDALLEITDHFEVVEFSNGVDLMASLLPQEMDSLPDVIFLDLRMPYMNGFECLNDIKNLPELLDIPIVIYSNWYKESEVKKLNAKGANLFLVKPSTFYALKKLLNQTLDKILELSTYKSKQFDIIDDN